MGRNHSALLRLFREEKLLDENCKQVAKCQQLQPDCVRSVLADNVHRIRIVLLSLAHLLTIPTM